LQLTEAERVSDPMIRAARYVAIAELREAAIHDVQGAVALYERALDLDPSQSAALDALDRIYRAHEHWERLIAAYEKQLTHVKDPRRQRTLNMALGLLYHDRAHSPERALAPLRAAMAGNQDQFPILVSLGRALADASKWAEHLEVLDHQVR